MKDNFRNWIQWNSRFELSLLSLVEAFLAQSPINDELPWLTNLDYYVILFTLTISKFTSIADLCITFTGGLSTS